MKQLITLPLVFLLSLGLMPARAQQTLAPKATKIDPTDSTTPQPKWSEAITQITCWTVDPLLGTRRVAPVDTLLHDYAQRVAIPSLQFGYASAITGNLGTEGLSMLYFDRPTADRFFFSESLHPYLPHVGTTRFFNTRIPFTQVSYGTGGGSEAGQDWLRITFSGNINRRAQVGGWLSYLYSIGSYANQASKQVNYGLNASYLGDHYQVMGMVHSIDALNKENGGITDDRYILDPSAVAGGRGSLRTNYIPVNLQKAHSHITGYEGWMNHRYNLGHYRQVNDSVRKFVPVSQLFWTFQLAQDKHRFIDQAAADMKFFEQHYFDSARTNDTTSQVTLRNTLGISLLEGFNRWAQAGLTAFATHEVEWQRQYMAYGNIPLREHESTLFVGGKLARERGKTINYDALGRVGLVGARAGDMDLRGNLQLNVRMLGDTASLAAYASFSNRLPDYFLRRYVSNHFIWDNDFGQVHRLRLGGTLTFPYTRTRLTASIENLQNLVYFNSQALPQQHSDHIQVVAATLNQDFKWGIFHWDNALTFQSTTNARVLPLPKFVAFSNAYLRFRLFTLDAQIGMDCNYTTSYSAMAYQPATMSFYRQESIQVGNYPMMDAYANLRLSKVRIYLLYSHFNQGLFGGSNYFSAAHYPLNPARFLLGLSIDFAN